MKPTTILEAHQAIESFARDKKMTQNRVIKEIAINEWIRQGDVSLQRIAALSNNPRATKIRQLAPGTSPGSRHIVSPGPQIFTTDRANTIMETRLGKVVVGPQIHADKGFTLTHPE